MIGYKPELKKAVENAVTELLSVAQVPGIIVDGFLVRLNQAFGQNEVQAPKGGNNGNNGK